jgi:hypothetical protein
MQLKLLKLWVFITFRSTLYIIQGHDSDDWSIECAKMSEVYGNSHFNIAAITTADGSYGFLEVGKEYRNHSFRLWSYTEGGRVRYSYHFMPTYTYEKSFLNAPLMQRA